MHTRRIASLDVSAIGLGCMNLSHGYGVADRDTAERVLNRALDLGCTFLDTAMVYGDGANEALIGEVLRTRRTAFVLASKGGMSAQGIDGRPQTLARQIDASLSRLKTDVIDLYYLHRADPSVPIEESVGAMGRLVEAGKVREIGLSEVSSAQLLRAHREWPVAAVQSEYSLWSRTPEHGLLDVCRQQGVTLVPFSPLGRQFLTGQARDVTRLPADDLRCTIARPRFEPAAFRANQAVLAPFQAIARRLERTPAQLALSWLLSRAEGTLVPIPGTKHLPWLEENLAAADMTLSTALIEELDELFVESAISGTRYTADRMRDSDAERDRLAAVQER